MSPPPFPLQFADANKSLLTQLPPPLVAAQYYRSSDLYYFDEFQTSKRESPRTPATNNLYDVFVNIRDDEGEHVKTMRAVQVRVLLCVFVYASCRMRVAWCANIAHFLLVFASSSASPSVQNCAWLGWSASLGCGAVTCVCARV